MAKSKKDIYGSLDICL